MALIDGVAERIGFDKRLAVLPVVVKGASQENSNAEVDVDQIGGDKPAVDDDAGSDVHGTSPFNHTRVRVVVAGVGIVERAPAAEKDAASADLLIPW